MRPSRELASIVRCLSSAAGLPGPARPRQGRIDWSRWQALAGDHQLNAFLYGRRSLEWDLPADVESELENRYVRAGNMAAVQTVELVRLLRALEGVAETVLLKGAALIPILYREATERSMWDIDLLFRNEKDCEKARALLERMGYRARRERRLHHHLPALVNPLNKIALELHTNLVTPPLPEGFMQEIWQGRRRVEGAPVSNFWTLDDIALLVHHCIHVLNDPIESPLLRNLFEVAWLASRLDPAGQARLKDLTARWGLAVPVGRVLWIAAGLFRSPTILDRPPRGAYEFWCARRLEWSEYTTLPQRWLRHVAAAHVVKLIEGASDRDPLVPIRIAFRDTLGAVRSRLARRKAREEAPLSQRPMLSAPVGEMVLLYNERSGETHLLNPLAARVWKAVGGPITEEGLVTRLQGQGLSLSESRQAIRALVARGILEQ